MPITGTSVLELDNPSAPLPFNRVQAERVAEVLGTYTRGALATAMVVGPSMVSRIMSGDRMPSTETLARLHRATNLPMESLLSYFLMRRAERQTGDVQ